MGGNDPQLSFKDKEIALPISLIAATTLEGGIGLEGDLPWRLTRDLRFFGTVTRHVKVEGLCNAVVMGRRTYESLPEKMRPLPGRLNVVVSTTMPMADAHDFSKDVVVVPSLQEAIAKLALTSLYHSVERIFIIGGARLYDEALQRLNLDTVYLTLVAGNNIQCDTFCKRLTEMTKYQPVAVSQTFSESDFSYIFIEYRNQDNFSKKKKTPSVFEEAVAAAIKTPAPDPVLQCLPSISVRHHAEFQYLDLIVEIINSRRHQSDRTGVGTYFKPGCLMRFDLKQSFPLLTTKNVFWKGVVEELLWFIRGDTNAHHLTQLGVKIWEKNGTREFLDSRGLYNREEGDLGPVYGFQWRHFGAAYKDCHTDYTSAKQNNGSNFVFRGQGIDQLKRCIDLIKESPTSRRILMSAWNPLDLDQMALPPCHILCQFFVADNELSCMLYQRSADMGLGVPFNIASYALLTRFVAQVTGLQPGELIHAIGNAHVYLNHVEALQTQVQRCPRPFPLLKIDPSITDITGFQMSHLNLIGYKPYPTIKMDMAV